MNAWKGSMGAIADSLLYKQTNRYLTIIGWLIADSVLRFKGRAFAALLSGFLGITFQLQAIALAFYFAKLIEHGKELAVLGYTLDARSSIPLLLLVGGAVFVSLMVSGWLIYFSRACTLKLMGRYEEFCLVRVVSLFGSTLKVAPDDEPFYTDSKLSRIARMDARYCGRALRIIVLAIVPFITLVVSVGSLLYINVILTLFIMVLMGISAAFQYRVNIQGAQNSRLMEQFSPGASADFRRLIHQYKALALPVLPHEPLKRKLFSSRALRGYQDAYIGRLRAMDKSRLVSDLLLGVAIFGIIIIMGVNIIAEKQGWGSLIIYLIALRYMLVSLKQSVLRLTSMNRYFPQIKRYFHFIENARLQKGVEGEGREVYAINAASQLFRGGLQSWNIRNGSRIGIVSPFSLDRYSISYLMKSLLFPAEDCAGSALRSMWFGTSRIPASPGGLRDTFGFPPDVTRQVLQDVMKEAEMPGRMNGIIPGDLDTTLSPDDWKGIDSSMKYALVLFSAMNTRAQWIVLEGEGLSSLDERAREYFLDKLSGKITVIVYSSGYAAAGSCGEELVAVVDDGRVVGMGQVEWFRENMAAIEEQLKKSPLSGERYEDRDDYEEDDLDDEM